MAKAKDTVDIPSLGYTSMSARWPLIHDLLGGTIAMRNAGETWLNKETREKTPAYNSRISRSILFNKFKDTIEKLGEKPFSQSVKLLGDPPEKLKVLETNVDRTGKSLTTFAKEMLKSAVTYGLTHVLVDFPQMPDDLTVEGEKDFAAQPVFIHVKPPNLIGWQTTRMLNGQEKLTQIRIAETKVVQSGTYTEKEQKQIRVYNEDTWELWIENEETKEFVMHSDGLHSFGRIPLITFYANREEYMIGSPPLEDLAWMNLNHWQSNSDHKNILRFARLGILWASGMSDEEAKKVEIGPAAFVHSANPESDMKYVEHGGKAIEIGRSDLLDIEEKMETASLRPMMKRTGTQTATARALDTAESHSSIHSWVNSLEISLRECYILAAEWTKEDIPEDFKVDIFSDFGLSMRASQDIEALIKMRQTNEITHQTFLAEMKRRDVLNEMLDVDAEVEDASAELKLVSVE